MIADADKMPAHEPTIRQPLAPLRQQCSAVFFALWPTAAERGSLAAWQKPLQHLCGGRDMRGENLHNTLVFIGHVEQSRLEALQLAAQEVSGEDFELCFDAARYWGHNHIVYAAPGACAATSGAAGNRAGTAPDDGTVSDSTSANTNRTSRCCATPTGPMRPLPAMQPVCWQMRDFVLVESCAEGGKAAYRVLARFPLLRYGG